MTEKQKTPSKTLQILKPQQTNTKIPNKAKKPSICNKNKKKQRSRNGTKYKSNKDSKNVIIIDSDIEVVAITPNRNKITKNNRKRKLQFDKADIPSKKQKLNNMHLKINAMLYNKTFFGVNTLKTPIVILSDAENE